MEILCSNSTEDEMLSAFVLAAAIATWMIFKTPQSTILLLIFLDRIEVFKISVFFLFFFFNFAVWFDFTNSNPLSTAWGETSYRGWSKWKLLFFFINIWNILVISETFTKARRAVGSDVCLVSSGSSLRPHQRGRPHRPVDRDSTAEAVLLKLKLPSALFCNFSWAPNPFSPVSRRGAVTECRLTVNDCRA